MLNLELSQRQVFLLLPFHKSYVSENFEERWETHIPLFHDFEILNSLNQFNAFIFKKSLARYNFICNSDAFIPSNLVVN